MIAFVANMNIHCSFALTWSSSSNL